jgi:DNA-binding winged helix-turn-helix (wHTH) protein
LGSRSFEVLRHFVLHPFELVKNGDLMDAIWSDPEAVDNNLYQQIRRLRKILGKTIDNREYIETVHGEGYRFIASVKVTDIHRKEVEVDSALPTQPSPPLAVEVNKRSGSREFVIVGIALVVLVGIWLVYRYIKAKSVDSSTVETLEHPFLLQGRQDLQLGDALEAKAILERAALEEPLFGPAHAELASALSTLGYQTRSRKEAQEAWKLLNGLGREDAFFVKGGITSPLETGRVLHERLRLFTRLLPIK